MSEEFQVPFPIDLSGQVAVVTGGSGVIGGMFCQALAACGAKVAVLGRNIDKGNVVVDKITAEGGTARAFSANVLDRDSLVAVRKEILDAFGKINILVNCAGGAVKSATVPQDQYADWVEEQGEAGSDAAAGPANPDSTSASSPSAQGSGQHADGTALNFFTMDAENIHKEFDLNVYGTILPTQILGQALVGQKNANIINIASMSSYQPLTRIPGYSAAKAAVKNFTEWAAVYFARSGIRVNAIAPGFFQTTQNHHLQFNADGTPTPRTTHIINSTPMGRFGDPHDLVGALLYLVNPKGNSFTTGVTLPVDGGFHVYPGV